MIPNEIYDAKDGLQYAHGDMFDVFMMSGHTIDALIVKKYWKSLRRN